LSAQNALTSSGGVGAFDRDFHGAGLRWHRSLAATSMTVGVDYEAAQDERKGWLNNNGTKGALKRNETDKVSQTGTYFQGEQYLSSNWIASSGVRYTRVAFDSRDHFICTAIGSSCSGSSQMVTASNFNPDDSGATEFTAWTGALGLVYKLAPAINLYANAGRSFETPTFIELAYRPNNQAGLNLALRDSRSRQYEIGLKTSLAADTRLNAALFHIDTANEIVVDTSLGGRSSYRNAGESRRQGMEISIDGAMGRYLSGYASATVIDAVFAEGFNGSGGPVAAGNRLPGVARYNAYGEIVWRDPSDCLSTAFEVRLSDRVMVNDINSEAATGYTTASWRIGINQTIGAWLFSGFLRVDNLFDRQYAGAIYVNDANGRFYAPAPGRSYLLGASFTMGY
jgi:iron complex outermembrane receptor protein